MSIIVNGKLRIKGVTTAGPGGGGGGTDADAQAFITAASITDSTQQSAINTLVVDLKAANIWTKMKALYPFVGGTATSHKFNLKDPRDLDAAYRLVFNGGWTHSSTGALPNGSNGYADSKFNARTQFSTNDNHLSFYSRTDQLAPTVDLGGSDSTYLLLSVRRSDAGNNSYFGINTTGNFAIASNDPNNTQAFYLGTRIGSTTNGFRNSTKIATVSATSDLRPNLNLYLGGYNLNGSIYGGYFSNKEYAFTSIGDGLSDAEVSSLHTAVQAFQTTLGRQV